MHSQVDVDKNSHVSHKPVDPDALGKWFLKNCTLDYVDKIQAEKMLGTKSLKFISIISPIAGSRSKDDSLWMIKDILSVAKFDFDRYFYAADGKLINSDKILDLIGSKPKSYGLLQSFYRQKKIVPSFFSEHKCDGEPCTKCEYGKKILRDNKISLADNWNDEVSHKYVSELLWNDKQVKQFLRNYQKTNSIYCLPEYFFKQTDDGFEKVDLNNKILKKVKEKKKPYERLPWPRMSEPNEEGKVVQLGINVREKMPDIIKIVHKFFKVQNVPMEELLQEVYAIICHKNHTKSAHNPLKSSLGHYIYMISNNVCIGFAHKNKRRSAECESIYSNSNFSLTENDHSSKSIIDSIESETDEHDITEAILFADDIERILNSKNKPELSAYVKSVRSNSDEMSDVKISQKMVKQIREELEEVINFIQH